MGFNYQAGDVIATELAAAYETALRGTVFAIAGSTGYVELSIREASAATRARVRVGDGVEFSLANT